MKLTTLFLLLSFTAHSQLAIQGGLNYSHFAHDHGYGKPIIGASVGISDKIPLGKFDLVASLEYNHKGAKNIKEDRNFNVYSVQITPYLSYTNGAWSLMAGPYYERVLFAKNSVFAGSTLTWSSHRWGFWNRNQFGLSTAVQYDLIGAMIQIGYEYGISQVRGELNGWDGKPDRTLWPAHNELLSAKLIIPLSTFH